MLITNKISGIKGDDEYIRKYRKLSKTRNYQKA